MKNYILILSAFLIPLISFGQFIDLQYPLINKSVVIENYSGLEITDVFRSIEDSTDINSNRWFNEQQQLADSVLNNICGRKKILESFLDYASRRSSLIMDNKIIRNGAHFYLKRSGDDNVSKLYYKTTYDAQEILLYDPASYETNSIISYFQPSWDGEKVVVALTDSGKEIADLLILQVDELSVLPDIIPGARPDSFLGVNWLPDNSGFTFLQFPLPETKNPNYAVLYKLGDSPDSLIKVFGPGLFDAIDIPDTGVYPIVNILSENDTYVVGYIATVENFWDVYFSTLESFKVGKPVWKKLYTTKEKVYTSEGKFHNDNYYFKSNKDFDNSALYKVSMSDYAFAKAELISKSPNNEIFKDYLVKANNVFFTTTKNGVESFLYHYERGKVTKVKLPKGAGRISLKDNPSDTNSFFVSISGWTTKNERYEVSIADLSFQLRPLSSSAEFPEFENILSKEVEVISEDGERIPLSIIYRNDLEMDGSNPTLFYGYGAYGNSIEPFYSSVFLHWVSEGGILCVPHVRGGGEKGEPWHQAGMMNNKKNTWQDLIASTEYMIAEGYTSPNKTAIYSMSAGGIMIGRAVTERPDLYAAAIAEVPIMNPLRSEFRTSGGGSNMLEYGSVKDSLQVRGLKAMDPYLNLISNTEYPAILLTGGKNDPRVPLWMPGKFLAKSQAFSVSKRPIIMRIDNDAGHGTTDEKLKYYQEFVDVFTFAFWQTGHKDYQLMSD